MNGANEQTHANSSVTGRKRARKERERPVASVPASGSESDVDGANEQTHVNEPVAGVKRARKERERPGASVPASGSESDVDGASEQTHANDGTIDGQCPVEVVIVDVLDESLVTKSAANGRINRKETPGDDDNDEGATAGDKADDDAFGGADYHVSKINSSQSLLHDTKRNCTHTSHAKCEW